ncbi:UPF0547 protein C16orf87 homolog [Parasteatoda tepidariorum]|uniref:UPF0547 domain-containing protein n=1 Tax=Parasteatoda tepidariorum TaxID=114398 RepID=A0A2L2Y5T0_PARTP|nr:UPF0547 protein C16orf87 homolog [Parasteatoda tepidariorum]
MVTKQCPKCQQHVPVACKACPCGHVFFVARRPISIHKTGTTEEGEVKRRRTERTKRERPDYFNSLQIENELKKMKNLQKTRKKNENSNEKDGEGSNSEEGVDTSTRTRAGNLNSKNRKRGRPKKNTSQNKSDSKNSEKEDEVDMFANLPKEKELQFSIILAEINRKILLQQFKPD